MKSIVDMVSSLREGCKIHIGRDTFRVVSLTFTNIICEHIMADGKPVSHPKNRYFSYDGLFTIPDKKITD